MTSCRKVDIESLVEPFQNSNFNNDPLIPLYSLSFRLNLLNFDATGAHIEAIRLCKGDQAIKCYRFKKTWLKSISIISSALCDAFSSYCDVSNIPEVTATAHSSSDSQNTADGTGEQIS